MICPKCGKKTLLDVAECAKCGYSFIAAINGAGAQPNCQEVQPHTEKQLSPGDLTAAIIPYRNPAALIGYYCAVFSLIPCIGLPLGAAAVTLGIIGERKFRADLSVKGHIHASIALFLGGLMVLVWGLLLVWLLASYDRADAWTKKAQTIRTGATEQQVMALLGRASTITNGPFEELSDPLNPSSCTNDTKLRRCAYIKTFHVLGQPKTEVEYDVYYDEWQRVCWTITKTTKSINM